MLSKRKLGNDKIQNNKTEKIRKKREEITRQLP